MTGTSASTSAATTSGRPPSILTAWAPPSLTKRMALATACAGPRWKEPKGMSATSSARSTPRRTARTWWSISSMVTARVSGWPSTTMASESPTRTTSAPPASAVRACGKS